jgi:hypothetical protein
MSFNKIKDRIIFLFNDGEGEHRQPTVKHHLILSLIPKQNILIQRFSNFRQTQIASQAVGAHAHHLHKIPHTQRACK